MAAVTDTPVSRLRDLVPPQPERSWRWRGLVAGAAAGALLLGGMFVPRFALGVPHLAELAADWLLVLFPLGAFDALLQTLGRSAKVILFVTVLALLWGLAALPGLWHARKGWGVRGGLWVGCVVWLVIGLILMPAFRGGVFGARLPAGEVPTALSLAALCAVYGVALGVLNPALAGILVSPAPGEPRSGIGRRTFLIGGAATALTIGLLFWLSRRQQEAAAQDGRPDLPRDRNGVMQDAKRTPGTLAPLLTANGDFYIVSKNVLEDPDLPPEVWGLRVTGQVETPLHLTYQDLIALPAVEQFQTLQCISNPVGGDLMSTARWKGVPLYTLLLRAGAQAWASKVLATSDDRYSTDIPYAVAMQPDTLLAYQMNGAPLPMEHGGPVRLLVPGRYGMKNAKWVTGIQVAQGDALGFWELNGWSDSAIAKTTSRIDTPAHGSTVGPGPVRVAGVAYGGRRGIGTVEFSTDGGSTWQAARLVEQPLSPLTWVRWEGEFMPGRAARTALVCRAVDGQGNRQQEQATPILPNGAGGLHRVVVVNA